MNKFMLELLKQAYNHYEKKYELDFDYKIRTANELFNYSNAAEYLADEDYIIPISDNIKTKAIDLKDFTLISFQLTEKGLNYCQRNFIS